MTPLERAERRVKLAKEALNKAYDEMRRAELDVNYQRRVPREQNESSQHAWKTRPRPGSKVRITGHLAVNGKILTGRVATVRWPTMEYRTGRYKKYGWVVLELGNLVVPAVDIRNLEPADS